VPIVFTETVHGTAVEVACYGETPDWVCRLSYAKEDRGPVTDGYYPPPLLGIVWVREQHHRWFASGMVNGRVFRDQNTISALIDQVRDIACPGVSIWYCMELVEPTATSILSGEEGFLFFPGDGFRARFGDFRT